MMDYEEIRQRVLRNELDGIVPPRKSEPTMSEKWDTVLKALAELYETYYRKDNDAYRQRLHVERALNRLLAAYNEWPG